jgi:hypothetical protein
MWIAVSVVTSHNGQKVSPGLVQDQSARKRPRTARLVRLRGRWLASADTPDGPSPGYGETPFAALWMALTPYDGVIDELLTTVPDDTLSG